MTTSTTSRFVTDGGIDITLTTDPIDGLEAITALTDALDTARGVLLTSTYDAPGRYTRWDIGFSQPPLVLEAQGRAFTVRALNHRGRIFLRPIRDILTPIACVTLNGTDSGPASADVITGTVAAPTSRVAEEDRSHQPSIFTVIRAVQRLFSSTSELGLGLFGAFGYDLAFQFEPVPLRLPRAGDQRDIVLYLPDEIIAVDHQTRRAERRRYDFALPSGETTAGKPRTGISDGQRAAAGAAPPPGDHAPGEYLQTIARAKEAFARGDLFEVVPGKVFYRACSLAPSAIHRRLRQANPSPYGFLINLGEGEHLIGASPEMYCRVEGKRVETSPISGTIARGRDPMEDARQVVALLSSEKEESELTMCTDVDRNDKSRICVPGSVRVLGRRLIEMYSKVIHTVDHVEGILRPEFDALDAFLTHTWAVTVTGAPKARAMKFIEDHERSPRRWYGGAVGAIGFDGSLNTGLTLRTVRLAAGVAEVRAGATLLFDSDPAAEEREIDMKASALLDALSASPILASEQARISQAGIGKRILLIDHDDSFVHTLANYLRQTGATVVTLRHGFDLDAELKTQRPHLVVLSPGPGRPADFQLNTVLSTLIERKVPVWGVCLGLQAIGEFFGGRLATLALPVHGKTSRIRTETSLQFGREAGEMFVGRYHSLHILPDTLPSELHVAARTDDGVVMALEHPSLPIAAVQFHPESIMSQEGGAGMKIVERVVAELALPR